MSTRGLSSGQILDLSTRADSLQARNRHVDDHEGTLGASLIPDGRHRNASRPRAESILSAGSLSSSLNLNIPTRSYYQSNYHGSQGSSDIPHYDFQEIREDTASLANRALEDNDPISRDTILEVSEPVTPEEDELTLTALDQDNVGLSSTSNSVRQSLPLVPPSAISDTASSHSEDSFGAAVVTSAIISQPHERTPLLSKATSEPQRQSPSREDLHSNINWPRTTQKLAFIHRFATNVSKHISNFVSIAVSPKSWDRRALFDQLAKSPLNYIPAVILGLLLNILDALSYGMILFPLGQPIFADLGPDGLSMFYVSCIVSQLTYSLGGSRFRGAIGSEMIEVVPFFHKMAFTIMSEVGEDKPEAVVATTILAYAISSILTGVVFWTMGKCKLGVLVGFLPRHLLIGCIGGVGFFLVVTGLEVSARLEGNLDYNMATLQKLLESDTLPLWTIPLGLAITLFVVKRFINHSLTDAAYFISIIIIFYIVVTAVPQLQLETLRSSGWVFEAPPSGAPWWHFYTLYNFKIVDWGALLSTVPAMCALTL